MLCECLFTGSKGPFKKFNQINSLTHRHVQLREPKQGRHLLFRYSPERSSGVAQPQRWYLAIHRTGYGFKIDKPYRQRIYRLSEPKSGTFESEVFTLPAPLRFAGKAQEIERLTPDSLTLREGCSVFLQRKGRNRFEGKTSEGTCPSDLRNAAYATSEVKLDRKKMCSWDRGYNKEGKQVWGATKGAYIFRRIRK